MMKINFAPISEFILCPVEMISLMNSTCPMDVVSFLLGCSLFFHELGIFEVAVVELLIPVLFTSSSWSSTLGWLLSLLLLFFVRYTVDAECLTIWCFEGTLFSSAIWIEFLTSSLSLSLCCGWSHLWLVLQDLCSFFRCFNCPTIILFGICPSEWIGPIWICEKWMLFRVCLNIFPSCMTPSTWYKQKCFIGFFTEWSIIKLTSSCILLCWCLRYI